MQIAKKTVSREEFLKLAGTGLAGAVLLGAAGCGGGGGQGSGGDSGGVARIRTTVTHYPTVLHAVPHEVGMEKGFFEEEGIKIEETISSGGGGTTVRNILAGNLAFADVSGAAAVQAHLSGAPISIVSSTVTSVADFYYVTRKDAPFETAKDLVGEKWAFTSPGSITQTSLLVVLEKLGIEPTSVELVAAGGLSEALTLLEEGGVAAAPLLLPSYAAEAKKWKTLFHFPKYVPTYQGTAFITGPQMAEENPGRIEGFINAYQRSANWIYQNPEKASEIYAKYADIDKEVALTSIKAAVEANFWETAFKPEPINNMVKGMQLAGLFEKGQEINWERLLNQSFLPEDKRVDVSALDTNT